jgi:hypothetical protein
MTNRNCPSASHRQVARVRVRLARAPTRMATTENSPSRSYQAVYHHESGMATVGTAASPPTSRNHHPDPRAHIHNRPDTAPVEVHLRVFWSRHAGAARTRWIMRSAATGMPPASCLVAGEGAPALGWGCHGPESARRTGWFPTGFLTARPGHGLCHGSRQVRDCSGHGTVNRWLLAVRLGRGRRLEVGHCPGARVMTRQVGSC